MTSMLKQFLGALILAASAGATQPLAATITYFHNDLAGSPAVATNEQGQVIWRESYRPYGDRLTKSAAGKPNTVWFTSRREDGETGLVYMGARYYDPMVGRFVSTDPKGFDESNIHSYNRFAYANNNPYRYLDPDGERAKAITLPGRAGFALGSLLGLGVVGERLGTALWLILNASDTSDSANSPGQHNGGSDVTIDSELGRKLGERGWTDKDVRDVAKGEPSGKSTDNRGPDKTADGKKRDDPASVYGSQDGYVVVNDRTREVVQVSNRNPDSGWVPDSRIKWNDK
jgi:RHS repeat-associated protein